MKIIFEDGKLVDIKRLFMKPDFIIDATDGVSSCINQLDTYKALNNPNLIIYTNSIFAFDNKYAWNNYLCKPEIFIRTNETGCFVNICELTGRLLREGHNLAKMYVSGEFDKIYKG